jgi:predicted Fe-Mo cluster-binding NifX family protein
MKGVHNMKVAVSSNEKNLDAQLDPRFGRCAYFLVVNPDDMSFEAFNNESAAQGGGAGIQAAQFLASQGVEAVITGNCGPNAVQTLSAAGVELFGGQTGTVREVVEKFKNGHLKPTSEATVDSHFGMNAQSEVGR